jgi:hypothetical protein
MANRQNIFLLKRSNVAGKVPAAGSLLLGELSLNTADVKLYASGTTTNSILPIGWDRIARTGDTMTGTLIVPTVSATTISATTFFGSGAGLTGIPGSIDTRVTATTFTNNTLAIEDSTGGTFSTVVNNFTGLTVNGILSAATYLNVTAGGTDTQIQYNSNGALTGTSKYTIDAVNQRIKVAATSGADAGFHVVNTGVGVNDTAAIRLENANAIATVFTTTTSSAIPLSAGFFSGFLNGFLVFPNSRRALRVNDTVSWFYGENDLGVVGFGTSGPTAQVHITGGTTAAGTASLKLGSGALLNTPETGAFEYNNTSLYFTRGTTRYDMLPNVTGNGQLIFNSGGTGYAGDANLTWNNATNTLTLSGTDTGINIQVITNEPAATSANQVRMYAKTAGGYDHLKYTNSSNHATNVQDSFLSNNITYWSTTSSSTGLWIGTGGAGAGTYSLGLPTNTSVYTTIKRGRYANVITTTNQQVGQKSSDAMWFRGSVTGRGGFLFFCTFGFDAWTAGSKLFVGLTSNTGNIVVGNPSANTNTIGFIIDSGDTAISFMSNSGGTSTKTAIGGQPTLSANTGYVAWIYMAPNTNVYGYRLDNINSGTTIVNTITTGINAPAVNTPMVAACLASNGANTGATAVNLGINRIYIETQN